MIEMPRFYLKAFLLVFALWFPAYLWIVNDLRPQPVFQDMRTDGVLHHQLPNYENGEPLTIEFQAPSRDITAIYWFHLIALPFHEAAISIENLDQKIGPIELGSPTVDELTRFDGKGFNEKGDRIRLSVLWDRETPPSLQTTKQEPARPITVFEDEELLAFNPVFYLGKKNPQKRSLPDPSLALYPEDLAVETYPLSSGVPITIRTIAPVDGLEMLVLPDLLTGESKATIQVEVSNLTTGQTLKTASTRNGRDFSRVLSKEKTSAGDEIEITLLWEESQPPRIQQAEEPSLVPLTVRDGDQETEISPIFLLQYRWPTKLLFALWLGVPALLFVALRSGKVSAEIVFIGLLATAAFASAAIVWQQNYTHQHMHTDPDRYGAYGEKMMDWLFDEEQRELNGFWIKSYPHAHLPLTPVIVGLGTAIGIAKSTAYLFLVGLSTIGTLLLLHFHLRHQLGLQKSIYLFGLLLFATHLLFLKAAGRPSTDALFLTITVALIVALTHRLSDGSRKNGFYLTTLLLAASLTRQPGLLYFFPVLALALGIDCWREGSLQLTRRIRTGFEIALPAVAVLAALYFSFDWFHSIKLAMEKSKEFHDFVTAELFLRCLVPLFSLVPLAWFFLGKVNKEVHRGAIVIYCTMLIFYVAMLWVVKAPFLTRLFLPVVPSVVLLAVLGIAQMPRRVKVTAYALVVILAAVSIGIMIYISGLPYLPPSNISPYIY